MKLLKLNTIIACLLAAMVHSPSPSMAEGGWNSSYGAAAAQAKAQHKLLMVDLYTPWCGWCKVMDAHVYPQPNVKEALSHFAPVKLNAEVEGYELASKFGIQSFPTIIFLKPDGTQVTAIMGYQPANEFADNLNQIAQDELALPRLMAAVKSNSLNTAARINVTTIELRRGNLMPALANVQFLETHGQASHLATVYNMMGDGYLGRQNLLDAAAYYNKALAVSSGDIGNTIRAHAGLFHYYAVSNNAGGAKGQLAAIINTKGIPAVFKKSAQQSLDQINKYGLNGSSN